LAKADFFSRVRNLDGTKEVRINLRPDRGLGQSLGKLVSPKYLEVMKLFINRVYSKWGSLLITSAN
jgi:hypothetical protein